MKIDESAFLAALSYDTDTGVFTWLVSIKNRWGIKPGDRAGSSLLHNGKRYRRIVYRGQHIQEHRLAFLFMEGELPPKDVEIDHGDGNGENNRWSNLNKSTRKENAKNLRQRENTASGVSGISWCNTKQKWRVRISKIELGYFDDLDVATKVRKEAEIQHSYHKNHGSVRPL